MPAKPDVRSADVRSEGNGPVIILSYLYSGAQFVQNSLAEDTNLACTTGTGVLPQCETTAAAWARISDRMDDAMSPLALSSIRALVSTQLTAILANTGRRRWCELVIAAPSAVQTFMQIVPSARCVCVHRACNGVISDAIAAHPWGLASPALTRFASRHPGNSVAAVAAYWVAVTERLLAFEERYPRFAIRVRYEDVVADQHELDTVRSALDLHRQTTPRLAQPIGERIDPAQRAGPAETAGPAERAERAETTETAGALQVPADMIPDDLRKRIDGLHSQLGYPPRAHPAGYP